jgi:hypothetical protein
MGFERMVGGKTQVGTEKACFVIKCDTVPTANQHVIVFDTTRISDPASTMYSAVATGTALLVPGANVGDFAAFKFVGTIKVVGQNVTIYRKSLTGAAGVAGDWETEDDGTITLTAGNTYSDDGWEWTSSDGLYEIVAGATPPTSITVRGRLIAR